eukprot:scpid107938/ scgid21651/ 
MGPACPVEFSLNPAVSAFTPLASTAPLPPPPHSLLNRDCSSAATPIQSVRDQSTPVAAMHRYDSMPALNLNSSASFNHAVSEAAAYAAQAAASALSDTHQSSQPKAQLPKLSLPSSSGDVLEWPD